MSLYPYPDVPIAAGVPSVVRSAVTSTELNVALSVFGTALLSALQSKQSWGIYDSNNNVLGGVSGLTLVESLYSQPTILSTVEMSYTRETRSANFPIELGSFASYNKVQTPATPNVTLALSGSSSDRTAFLNALEVACISTTLYSVITPEVQYVGYSIDRYTYRRSASKGATLIMVDISLSEIRQVSSAYTTATPLGVPAAASATPQVNNGNVQAAAPDQSTLLQITNKVSGWLNGGSN